MSVSSDELWGWAKTNRKPTDDPAFERLSLDDHGRDVAAVFAALLRGPFRGALAHAVGRDDEALIGDLAGLVGLHDLGKVSWTFQGREHGPTPLPKERRFEFEHHSDEACALLQAQHRPRLDGWHDALRPIADIENLDDLFLLAAVFSHHGKPRNGRQLIALRDLPDRFLPLPGDSRDPRDLARQLVASFPPRAGPQPLAGLAPDRRPFACHWLMGMVNLADWVGSSVEWFPLRPVRRGDFDHAAAAVQALAAVGLDGAAPADAPESDEAAIARTLKLYTEGKAAGLRRAQARVVEAALAKPLKPGDVLVLEEETGGGKTLAAYLVHALLARRGLAQGLTFCLPTRASAKAIHDGAARVYRRFPPVLALPGYDETAPSPLPADRARENGERDLPWVRRSRHRFLVAPVAVTTVDQVLLGTLPVRYAHLRSCAVARNLLVIDEVHSSDPYMRELLAEAVARQRRLGGVTLLMSATLGAELRARLLASGTPAPILPVSRCRGAAPTAPSPKLDPDTAIAAPYPVLWRGADDPVRLVEGDPPQKPVHVEPAADWPIDAVGRVAALAVDAAQAGARVLVIRNTVRLARATAAVVRDLAPELVLSCDGHSVCHHARYARADRLRLDDELRAALDPDPVKRAGSGVIAVSTQTAEQSLDVDADLLITDLVPADVLLQRIGRLHRNRSPEAIAARPRRFVEPRCVVLAPERAETLLSFANPHGAQPNNWGIERAYANLLALAATHEKVGRDGSRWLIPSANRRLVEETTAEVALRAVAARYGRAGDEAFRRLTGKTLFEQGQAKHARFTFDTDPSLDLLRDRFDESRQERTAMTRLGLTDVRLAFARPFTSPFGNPVDAVTVPGHIALAIGLKGDQEASWTAATPHEVTITLAGHGARFAYGPFGLDVASDGGNR